jgi:hypothetical protein
MPTTADKQENEEMTVFRAFAAACRLPLLPDTAKAQKPPLPDITCTLTDGGTLNFELVQCEDVTSAGTKQGKPVAVTDVEKRDHHLTLAIETEYTAAVADGRIAQPERFEYHTIDVHFENDASALKCRNAIPHVIKKLNELGPGVHGIGKKPIRSIECTRWSMTPSSYKGPMFDCNGIGIHVAVSIVDKIRNKVLDKTYESDAPIHLLAWSLTASEEEMKLSGQNQELADFLKSNGMGLFTRIWVFDLSGKAIAFDSASIDN